MISFSNFTLDNGLSVFVHEDPTVNIAVMNLLYDVGSRDEDPNKTGLAHLFEHLMFGGSKNIPNYDEALLRVGGENNAFTSNDITNYYLTLPANNLETGFWLESDRMLSLNFDPKGLEIQRNVVIEEFKQCYLNKPYGDVWLQLLPLAYKKHPYQWATIGKEISHIEKVTLSDIKDFFYKYYIPSNATLVVAGNVSTDEVKKLSQKWFGPIPFSKKSIRNLAKEPKQKSKRTLTVEAPVPTDALYKVYHMPSRFHTDYYASSLLSDILGRGKSSRLYQQLVQKEEIFTKISSYTSDSIDDGLFIIHGMVTPETDLISAEKKIDHVLQELISEEISDYELQKVKNQEISSLEFGEVEVINRAMNLAFASLSGDPNNVNNEARKIESVRTKNIQYVSNKIFDEKNSNSLYYKSSGYKK